MRSALLPIALLATSCATTTHYERLAVADLRAVAAIPVQHWQQTAFAAGAVAATTLIDHEVRDAVARNHSHSLDEITRAIEPLGGGRSTAVILGFLGYGLVRNDERAKATAFDSAMSSLIASRAITPAIKVITRRTRPNSGHYSFPSNHTTEAFALASSIAMHYPAARYVAYGLAGGVGFARIYHNAHWISDVAAGAIIGTAVGHTVFHTNVVPMKHGVAITISTDASALFRGRCAGSNRPSRSAAAP
ncbi:MAG TPA: phosphatase PAP2 family protein [Thermoanaerobaculia bacterium]